MAFFRLAFEREVFFNSIGWLRLCESHDGDLMNKSQGNSHYNCNDICRDQ
jgi:hypothetical protein